MGERAKALLDQLVEMFLAEGFLDVQLADLASRLSCSKSTLYSIAPSKEQLIVAVVKEFFRRSTGRVEGSLDPNSTSRAQLEAYLMAISEQLAPASPAFFQSVNTFAPAREIYATNTRIAAKRVQSLVRASKARLRGGPDAAFAGAVAGLVMEAIHSGEIGALTGLDDSQSYRALAGLIGAGLSLAQREDDP